MRPASQTALAVIAQEAKASRTVIIDASELDGSREVREVEPYSLRQRSTGVLFFAWCLEREEIRSWRVENLNSAQPTGRSFAPRFDVEF
jgi:predicted DNA-binding transcriptional regulator YafY